MPAGGPPPFPPQLSTPVTPAATLGQAGATSSASTPLGRATSETPAPTIPPRPVVPTPKPIEPNPALKEGTKLIWDDYELSPVSVFDLVIIRVTNDLASWKNEHRIQSIPLLERQLICLVTQVPPTAGRGHVQKTLYDGAEHRTQRSHLQWITGDLRLFLDAYQTVHLQWPVCLLPCSPFFLGASDISCLF